MRGLSLIIYGTEGVGKTSFCLQFKKEILCGSIRENGFENLEMVGAVPDGCDNQQIGSFKELLLFIRKAKDYETLILDSVSGIQQIIATDIIEAIYKQHDNPAQAFASFSEGYRLHAPRYVEQICNELTLLNGKGVNTLLIGHVRNETVKNPSGNDYVAAVLDMESWPRAVFVKWAAAVLYMTLDAEVMVTKTWKGKPTEGKVRTDLEEDSDRIMYTTKNLSHSAKNLLNLPPYISLGESPQEAYKRFFEKLPPPIQEAQKQ
jgi:hypothetical protein